MADPPAPPFSPCRANGRFAEDEFVVPAPDDGPPLPSGRGGEGEARAG